MKTSIALSLVGLLMASAQAFYDEKYRPQFHYSPKQNWLNDPNGLFQDNQGNYHMFYQYNPYGDQWGHMSWGHAVSKDLVHWQEKEVALYEESGVMIYSGSAVVDEKNTTGWQVGDQEVYVLIYTGQEILEENQNLAYSNDGGKSWKKYDQNPVLRIPYEFNFRDPKVMWYAEEQKWVMTVSVSAEQKVHFYESQDLKNWTKTGEYGVKSSDGAVWECPDLMQLTEYNTNTTKWVLIVNVNPGGYQTGSGAKYYIGNFDGKTFTADDSSRVDFIDYGADFYAVTSYFKRSTENQTYTSSAFAWMSNWAYSSSQPTSPWRGQMSFPRLYNLFHYNNKLYVRALFDYEQGLKNIITESPLKVRGDNQTIDEVNQQIASYVSQNSDLSYIKVIFQKEEGQEVEVGLDVKTDFNQTRTVLGMRKDCSIYVDKSASGNTLNSDAFKNQKDAKTEFDCVNEDKIKIEAIIDRSSVEALFFSWYSLTNTIYTEQSNSGIKLWASDLSVKVKYVKLQALGKSMGTETHHQVVEEEEFEDEDGEICFEESIQNIKNKVSQAYESFFNLIESGKKYVKKYTQK